MALMANQEFEVGAAGFGRFRVEFGKTAKRIAVVEQTGIEEVRREPSRLGFEFAKAQYLAAQRKFNEILTKIHIFPFYSAGKTGPIIAQCYASSP